MQYLGNLSALRNWGHAKDYVEMMCLMLQQDQPEDFVITTGVQYSVRALIERAFAQLGISLDSKGEGLTEVAIVRSLTTLPDGEIRRCRLGDPVVRVDPRYFRPAEVETLLGDASKARERLGWEPRTTFEQLVCEMVLSDFDLARRDSLIKAAGFKSPSFHE